MNGKGQVWEQAQGKGVEGNKQRLGMDKEGIGKDWKRKKKVK